MKSNKKILLVEDDPNFGKILKDYLTINNYEISLAVNGIEGFEKFNKSEFDLCILDIMMPFKDGFLLSIDFIFASSISESKGFVK